MVERFLLSFADVLLFSVISFALRNLFGTGNLGILLESWLVGVREDLMAVVESNSDGEETEI